MRPAFALGLLVATACSDSAPEPETYVKASTDAPAVAAVPALIPLDTLVAQLDTARGYYWPKTGRQLELTNANLQLHKFRAHSRPAVQRLIDCMRDTTTTATFHADDPHFKYPRGVLCYEVLRAIVDFDASRELPIHLEDVYVSMEKGQVAPELARARRAWQVIHDAKAYRMRVLSAP